MQTVEQKADATPLSAVELAAGLKLPDGSPQIPFAHRAYICNITELAWPYMDYAFGRFKVDGCKPGEEYHLELITARIQRNDHGDKNTTEEPIGALHIAHDMVRQLNENVGTDSFVGVFVVEYGKKPTAAQLAEQKEKLRKYCTHFCQIAKEEYSRYKNGAWIPDFARFAAKYLGLEDMPYMVEAPSQTKCPVCVKPIAEGTIKCPTCGAILDEAKARKYHLLPERQEAHESGSTEQTGKAAKSRQ
jgi:hypothetical protein